MLNASTELVSSWPSAGPVQSPAATAADTIHRKVLLTLFTRKFPVVGAPVAPLLRPADWRAAA